MAKKGLSLSGGGARGSFQIGALKALYEVYGFRPDVIGSTSVGSVNGIKLAAEPPPKDNDAKLILEAVAAKKNDPQLRVLGELVGEWLAFVSPSDFFAVREPFKGTPLEEFVAKLNEPSYDEPADVTIRNVATNFLVAMNIPIVNWVVSLANAAEIDAIIKLVRGLFRENALLSLSPVEARLRDPARLDLAKLAKGTPLYMALVSLETGRLRYVTNKSEFVERDGKTPVATALMAEDFDPAIDPNLTPEVRSRLLGQVDGYKAAVGEMKTYRAEYNLEKTSKGRRRELIDLVEQARERGNYFSDGIEQQIKAFQVRNTVDPVLGVLGSAAMPVYFEPAVIGVEQYIDGGLREIIPVEIVASHEVEELVAIVCSAQTLPATDSMSAAGLPAVAMRALADIALEEIVEDDQRISHQHKMKVTQIAPTFDVHDVVVVQPSLIEISMAYGWMRAADEMHPADEPDRPVFRRLSDAITWARLRCLRLEREWGAHLRHYAYSTLAEGLCYELRGLRWAILQLVRRRSALGLPAHPDQLSWFTGWEREWRTTGPIQEPASTVWGLILARDLARTPPLVLGTIAPAASWDQYQPDGGVFVDQGSLRRYWIVRGAIFEDPSGAPRTGRQIPLPHGVHQFLPRIPAGNHLMAEVQSPASVWLVTRGKRYPANPAMVAAAGLTGAVVALVPTGGLKQIPAGTTPATLGGLVIVDRVHTAVLDEIALSATESTRSSALLHVYNRTASTIRNISVQPVGFDAAAGVAVDAGTPAPNSIPANTIDTVSLRLNPSRAGNFNGAIRISSSDAAMPVFDVPCVIRAAPLGDIADLAFTIETLELEAAVNVGTSTSVTIENRGRRAPDSVVVRIESTGNEFRLPFSNLPVPGDFGPGARVVLPVYFTPLRRGRFDARLMIEIAGQSSAGTSYTRVASLPLTGHGRAAAVAVGSQPNQPALSLSVDLGAVQPPAMNAGRFYIGNQGDQRLDVSALQSSDWIVSESSRVPKPLQIQPGQWVEVPIDVGVYALPSIGPFMVTMKVASNDPISPEVSIAVRGVCAGARIVPQPEFLDFGTVAKGSTVQRPIKLENAGTLDLTIAGLQFARGHFALANPVRLPLTVAPGTSHTLLVQAGPRSGAGQLQDLLTVTISELPDPLRLMIQANFV